MPIDSIEDILSGNGLQPALLVRVNAILDLCNPSDTGG